MRSRGRYRNLLSGRYGLGEMAQKKKMSGGISPTIIDVSLVGSGLLLGLVSFPYKEAPIGQTLLVAGGGLAAVGLAFLIRDLMSSKAVATAVGA